MKTQTFGIEIEMNRITRAAAAQVLADHFDTRVQHIGGTYDTRLVPDAQGRDWKIVSDNSIEGPQEERTEFVSPICHWEDIETVQELVRKLRAAGAKAHTSCGVHVHIGRGQHTPKTLRNLVNLVNAKEDLLTQALGISPERRARWCQAVDPDFLARLNRRKPTTDAAFAELWYNTPEWRWHASQHYDTSRYHLLYVQQVFMLSFCLKTSIV